MRNSAFTVAYRGSAMKALSRIPSGDAERVVKTLLGIAADPFGKHPNVRPLKGIKAAYRARIGDVRACYTLDRGNRLMDVFEIAQRGGAYRW